MPDPSAALVGVEVAVIEGTGTVLAEVGVNAEPTSKEVERVRDGF